MSVIHPMAWWGLVYSKSFHDFQILHLPWSPKIPARAISLSIALHCLAIPPWYTPWKINIDECLQLPWGSSTSLLCRWGAHSKKDKGTCPDSTVSKRDVSLNANPGLPTSRTVLFYPTMLPLEHGSPEYEEKCRNQWQYHWLTPNHY